MIIAIIVYTYFHQQNILYTRKGKIYRYMTNIFYLLYKHTQLSLGAIIKLLIINPNYFIILKNLHGVTVSKNINKNL